MSGAGVLVAADLTPAETAALDLDLVAGVILAEGSPTSHAAILARARGIPAVVSAGPARAGAGRGHHGRRRRQHRRAARRPVGGAARRVGGAPREAAELSARQLALGRQPAVTARDGASCTSPPTWARSRTPARRAVAGADGAGLVRTEFLFLDRADAPTVEEQRTVYDEHRRGAGRAARSRCAPWTSAATSRCPTCPMPAEANPFLGQRGIRLSLEHRDLLRDQLAAMCATARRFPVDVMFPMVARRAS